MDGVVGGHQLHLADVEAELVQPFEPPLDDPQLVGVELLGVGDLSPQLSVSLLDRTRHLPRVDVDLQATAGLEVEQSARHVLGGDVDVEEALAVGELGVAFGRLEVDRVGGERSGIPPEQGVGQGAVTPPEPGEVEAYQQPDHRVEHALAEVRDREPTARQQCAVRQ